MKVLAVGDVHLGNINADIISFINVLKKGLSEKPNYVVFLGDVIEGALKYFTQIFKISSVRPIDIQRELFRRFVADLVLKHSPKTTLVVVKGNHDINYIEDFLKPAFQGTKVRYEYVNEFLVSKTVFIHYITRRSRGSYATAITPMHVTLALASAKQWDADRIVYSHIHRGLSIVVVGGIEIIALPSFLRYNDTYDNMYSPPSALILTDEEIKIIKSDVKPSIAEVQKFNVDAMNEILKELIEKEGGLKI